MQRPEVFHRDHCFEYPKNPDKIKPSKQILAKFPPPPPAKSQNRKSQPLQNILIVPVTQNL